MLFTATLKRLVASLLCTMLGAAIGLLLVGLVVRLALNYPGNSMTPLLVIGLSLLGIFAFVVFRRIRSF